MKVYTDAAMAAILAGTAMTAGAVWIDCDPAVRVWSGNGPWTIDGEEYVGIGHRGLVKGSGAALGGTAQAMSLTLSGVDPDALALLDADDLRRAPVVVSELIFDGSGTRMLDHEAILRGAADLLTIEETPGGEATITLTVETAARALGRRGGRMRTDADQRLIEPTDGGLKHVSYAGQKTLYWGGQRPSTVTQTFGTIWNQVINAKIAASQN